MRSIESTPYHKTLKDYANSLIHLMYIKEGLKIDGLSPDDLVSEAYIVGATDIESAKKPMRDFLFRESRVLKGRLQQGGISPDYEKRCIECKLIKPANDFTWIYREEFDYTYLKSKCKVCRAEESREYRKKNPPTENQKMKSKLRGERYRARQQN